MKIFWKVVIALLAILFSLCSACGFMFTFFGREVWSISIPCFVIFGVLAYGLWWYFARIGDNESRPTGLDLNG